MEQNPATFIPIAYIPKSSMPKKLTISSLSVRVAMWNKITADKRCMEYFNIFNKS